MRMSLNIMIVFFGISILPATTNVFAQESGSESFPSWFRNVAEWWSEGIIDDNAFVSSAQYLINEGLISLPISEPKTSGSSDAHSVPDWVRNNAGWWAEGLISDEDFASGLQYLIDNNIMGKTQRESYFFFYKFTLEKSQTENGEKIIWTSKDFMPHTITSGSPSSGIQLFDSGVLQKGEKTEYTFEKDGDYSFFCMLHPWETSILKIPFKSEDYQKPKPSFVDPNEDPYHYVTRYLNEPEYKNWFTTNHPDYTIYESVGLSESEYLEFVESEKEKAIQLALKIREESGELAEEEAQKIVREYGGYFTAPITNEESKIVFDYLQEFFTEHKDKFDPDIVSSVPWTDYQHSEEIMDSLLDTTGLKDEFYKGQVAKWKEVFKNRLKLMDDIHIQGVEKIRDLEKLDEPKKDYYIRELDKKKETGKILVTSMAATLLEPLEEKARIAQNQQRIRDELERESETFGGGCLIATATYGSELSSQVQQLRELRDNTLLQTKSGSAFMIGFNQFYYSFSPTIADWERQNAVFKEAVKLTITPLITSLSILNYVDIDSEEEMLGYGIGIILLNTGIYFAGPVGLIFKIRKMS